ncbi:MAG: aldo/keto reductase [Acidobacteria bacterium]|nr:aldo/keto reductase [Acidobacteriota bacterium]
MTEVKKRIFGRTGLQVSEIALGTVELGLDYGIGDHAHRPAFEDAARILHRALDLGVNLIDTARAYGEAETVIGRALAERRSEFILATKVAAMGDPRESLETSLRELRTGVLDIVQIHGRVEDVMPDPAVVEGLHRARDAGMVRFLGASVYNEAAALAAIEAGFDCIQIAHSVLDRRPEPRALPAAARAGTGVIARSVLVKGALSPRAADLPPALAPLRDAVLRLGPPETLPELAYRYLLSQEPPHTLLVGASSVAELEAAVRFARKGPLDAAGMERLRAEPLLDATFISPALWPQTA